MEVKELLLVRNVWLFPATNLHFFHPKPCLGSATGAQGTAEAQVGSNNCWIRVNCGILATLGVLMTSENIFFPLDTAAGGLGQPKVAKGPRCVPCFPWEEVSFSPSLIVSGMN